MHCNLTQENKDKKYIFNMKQKYKQKIKYRNLKWENNS